MSDINNDVTISSTSTSVNYTVKEEEHNDIANNFKMEIEKYSKYKIIYEAIKECVAKVNNGLDERLKHKIKDIILAEECSQTTTFVDKSNRKLTNGEKFKLMEELKLLLTNFNKDEDKAEISNEYELARKITTQQEEYEKNILIHQSVLSELVDLKLKNLPKLTEDKIRECTVLLKFNHLKSEMMRTKFRVDVFAETNKSLQAYNEVIDNIKKQQEECLKDINNLKQLKEKYERVSCKQYYEILKKYLQYKSNIVKKKLL